MALTAKQEQFCQEYLIDLNGAQAAIRAGYSKKTAKDIACQNLAKLNISTRIAELQAIRLKRVEIDQDWVLNNLKTIAERCMQSEPVTSFVDGEQKETGEYKFEHSGANKSLELIGKHLKMFTDKVDNTHSGPDGQPIKTESNFNFIPVGNKH